MPVSRSKSLLVDYSKSKASHLVDYSKSKAPQELELKKSLKSTYEVPESISLRSLVREGRQQQCLVEDNEGSNSSFSLPDLTIMDKKEEGEDSVVIDFKTKPPKSLLGESKETVDSEELDDSFHQSFANSSFAALPSMSDRRGMLAGTRKYQSLSNLGASSPIRRQSDGDEPVLSFSMRRRRSSRDNNNNTSRTSKGPPLGRSKTWDMSMQNSESRLERFQESIGTLNVDELDDDTRQADSPKSQGIENPAQNRRAMLFRHSSVSALSQGAPQGPDHPWAPVFSPMNRRPGPTRAASMRVFSPATNKLAAALPDTIEIRPKLNRRSSERRTSERRNRPERSSSRKSLRGSSHHRGSGHIPRGSLRGGSNHSGGRRRNAMPTISTDGSSKDLMSASTQSYFTRGPVVTRSSTTGRLPSRRDLMQASGRATSSRRDLMQASGRGTSRRDLMAGTGGRCPSRRDLMQRQKSSRRNLGANSGGDHMMDDSSQFVTGSRIRRGTSCRQLLM